MDLVGSSQSGELIGDSCPAESPMSSSRGQKCSKSTSVARRGLSIASEKGTNGECAGGVVNSQSIRTSRSARVAAATKSKGKNVLQARDESTLFAEVSVLQNLLRTDAPSTVAFEIQGFFVKLSVQDFLSVYPGNVIKDTALDAFVFMSHISWRQSNPKTIVMPSMFYVWFFSSGTCSYCDVIWNSWTTLLILELFACINV